MPAALILDDDSSHGMLSLARSGSGAGGADVYHRSKPINLQPIGNNMTCEQQQSSRSSPLVVPHIEDCAMSDINSYSTMRSTNFHPALRPSFLLAAALEILNCPTAETLDLLAVMRALPYEAHVQRMACERLWVESFEDDEAHCLAQEGGISLVVSAMACFPNDTRLQHCAAAVLQNVAALEDEWYAHEICERGGVTLLVTAMKNHNRNHCLQLCGCTTIASLAEVSVNNQEHIKKVGGIEAVLQARWYHGTQPTVLEGARQALEALGYQEEEEECEDCEAW